MTENRYKRLASNSLLFLIGNFGSKLITFFMLPIYTAKLSQGEYGISDLVLTTVSLLLPIISLSVFESVLRFSMDPESNKREIFTNAMVVSIIGCMFLLIGIPAILFFNISYGIFVIVILIVQIFQSIFSQYAKAAGYIGVYAINGIILSCLTAFLNIIFLIVIPTGIQGYLFSILLAYIFSNSWLFFKLNLYKEFKISLVNKKLIKDLLFYSIPLIPNSVALWINNVANRYFILYYLGKSANGVFAIANKIPLLLGVINSIFFQAWQMSAIEEFEKKDRDSFYSNTFSIYSKILFWGVSSIIFILRPMMKILVSVEFVVAWKYVPFLLLSILYSSFSGFLGQYYIASKQTIGVFITTITGAIINIITNFLLIPALGLVGASVSSALSFFVLWLIRIKDTKKFVSTNYDVVNIVGNHLLIVIQILFLFILQDNVFKLLIIEFFLWIISSIHNREILLVVSKLIWRKNKK
ncbi:lipopolysaccharide biosynthesis protein [Enterococcus mediterraneensis]|uniref:lipopolysaccharide biosynthesis protein n=1 Tax=Enterococcus mediterraneensis TaxID=2364791 RepID=UPI000F0600CE|nr:polysaccharide biosynthesis C-terminal domain-containing protein [Enterococcus mediterraneensis]